eukprot:8453186-Alexandrium_andersonii.AAC.1
MSPTWSWPLFAPPATGWLLLRARPCCYARPRASHESRALSAGIAQPAGRGLIGPTCFLVVGAWWLLCEFEAAH